MGSRSHIEKAYIAGFLDGDGSLMLQLKKRTDTQRGYRFMATICLYQDTRHEQPLHWMRDVFGVGYISARNDKISELRINGFSQVRSILEDLQPFLKFKVKQAEALRQACEILESGISKLSKDNLLQVVDCMLAIQHENYKATRKKSRQEILKILGLTP